MVKLKEGDINILDKKEEIVIQVGEQKEITVHIDQITSLTSRSNAFKKPVKIGVLAVVAVVAAATAAIETVEAIKVVEAEARATIKLKRAF